MSQENIKLKRATVEDIPSILEVEKSVVGTKIYSGLTGSDDAIKELEENIYFLIEKDGKVVGDTSYQMKDKNHAYISGLAVAKEFQGQGIARAAMKILLEQLKDIKLVDLVTHPENETAISLYESLGFERTGERMENYFGDGEPRIRMVFKIFLYPVKQKNNIGIKIINLSQLIKEDFKKMDEKKLENFFNKFISDKSFSFIRYYNRTVLDKEKINFKEFISPRNWAIRGMTNEAVEYFNKNNDKLKEKIIIKKDIFKFFNSHCYWKKKDGRMRREGSFCSKLFHTFLPNEFPPVDKNIRDHFNLRDDNFIKDVLLVKEGYQQFIKENPEIIKRIRIILSKDKFSELRVKELSNIRILDMFYWFKK